VPRSSSLWFFNARSRTVCAASVRIVQKNIGPPRPGPVAPWTCPFRPGVDGWGPVPRRNESASLPTGGRCSLRFHVG